MPGKITVLVENKTSQALATEHGLSFFIELEGHTVLFDSGQSDAFLQNAKALGCPIEAVDTVILSHGHYDHTDGIPHLLNKEIHPTCYLGKEFFVEKYTKKKGAQRYIGANFTSEDLQTAGWRVLEVLDSPHPLFEDRAGFWIATDFARNSPFEPITDRFTRKPEGGERVPDSFEDEIMLVVETSKGLLLVVGCAHPGIVNMIESVRQSFQQPIAGILGGVHLHDAESERIDHVLQYFRGLNLSFLGIAHCTGEAATDRASELKLPIVSCAAGESIHWE